MIIYAWVEHADSQANLTECWGYKLTHYTQMVLTAHVL